MPRNTAPFYTWVAGHACARCGCRPTEVAHVRAFRSPKTDDLLPRRYGVNAWAVVPLCPACHRLDGDSIHAVGEEAFEASLGRGTGYLAQKAGSLLAEWVTT